MTAATRPKSVKESAKSTRRALLLLSSRASVHFVIKHEFRIGRSMRTVSAWPRLNTRHRRAGFLISSKTTDASRLFISGLTSARFAARLAGNSGSRSDSLTSSGHSSALISAWRLTFEDGAPPSPPRVSPAGDLRLCALVGR